MGGPDVPTIRQNYEKLKDVITGATKATLSVVIGSMTGGLDGDIIATLLSWVANRVMKMAGWDPKTQALTIALRIDYLKRTKSGMKAWNLTNKCSLCKCIGHNKRVRVFAFYIYAFRHPYHLGTAWRFWEPTLVFAENKWNSCLNCNGTFCVSTGITETRAWMLWQNHPTAMDEFLKSKDLGISVAKVIDAIEDSVEVDGDDAWEPNLQGVCRRMSSSNSAMGSQLGNAHPYVLIKEH